MSPQPSFVVDLGRSLGSRSAVCDVVSVVRSGGLVRLTALNLDEDRLRELAEQLGYIYPPASLPAYLPLESVIKIESSHEAVAGMNWHLDQSFADVPPDFSMLYALDVDPPVAPTAFCDGASVFASLSKGLQASLKTLTAEHIAFYPTEGETGDEPGVRRSHPCVVPVEGGDTVFLAPATVRSFDDWSRRDSRPILKLIFDMMNWPEFTYTHWWAQGDLLIWPSRRYPHRAVGSSDARRRTLLRVLGSWHPERTFAEQKSN
jgi:alpha-ketoglutarate-dependent taurine dioxygenase